MKTRKTLNINLFSLKNPPTVYNYIVLRQIAKKINCQHICVRIINIGIIMLTSFYVRSPKLNSLVSTNMEDQIGFPGVICALCLSQNCFQSSGLLFPIGLKQCRFKNRYLEITQPFPYNYIRS